jgi:hypothetical protein
MTGAKRNGPTVQIRTVGELLFWSYSNVAASEVADNRGLAAFDRPCFMVRARLFKGLRTGTMNVGSLFDDVRRMPQSACMYCGATPPPKLHADHLIPRYLGGLESADNLVWACGSCNSSKGARDLLDWYRVQNRLVPWLLARRYLKLAMQEATAKRAMDSPLSSPPALSFRLDLIPTRFQLANAQRENSGEPPA